MFQGNAEGASIGRDLLVNAGTQTFKLSHIRGGESHTQMNFQSPLPPSGLVIFIAPGESAL